jgi:hypothetical protein
LIGCERKNIDASSPSRFLAVKPVMPHFPPAEDAESPSTPASRPLAQMTALLALAVVAGAMFVRTYFVEAPTYAELAEAANQEQAIDKLFIPYAANGNIWLHFDGFAANPGLQDRWAMLQWYTRTTYAVYPRRVFVADDNTVIPAGFMGNPIPPFSPTPAWLAEHGVKSMLTLSRTSDQNVNLYYKAL